MTLLLQLLIGPHYPSDVYGLFHTMTSDSCTKRLCGISKNTLACYIMLKLVQDITHFPK